MNELPPTYVKKGVATSMAVFPSQKARIRFGVFLHQRWHVMIEKKCLEIFEEKKTLQWSSATLRLLSEARSPKRRSFIGCNLISKRSIIKTRSEAACTVSARSSSEKSDSSGWWTCTTDGRLYVVAAWKDYIALCLSILAIWFITVV